MSLVQSIPPKRRRSMIEDGSMVAFLARMVDRQMAACGTLSEHERLFTMFLLGAQAQADIFALDGDGAAAMNEAFRRDVEAKLAPLVDRLLGAETDAT